MAVFPIMKGPSVGGYDKRDSVSGRRNLTIVNTTSSGRVVTDSAFVADTVCSVTSWRSTPTGELVPTHVADPYAWFLNEVTEGRRKAAQAARRLGTAESYVVDNGHAFQLERHMTRCKTGRKTFYDNRYGESLAGNFVTSGQHGFRSPGDMLFKYKGSSSESDKTPVNGVTPFALMSTWNAEYYGKKALSTLAPNKPELNVAVTLSELLREGLPTGLAFKGTLVAAMLNDPKKLGELGKLRATSILLKNAGKGLSKDYLELMFAIVPLVRDIYSLGQALYNASEILSQWQDDAGKGIRRSMVLLDSHETKAFSPSQLHEGEVGILPRHWPAEFKQLSTFTGNFSNGLVPQTRVTQIKREKIYFSGSFSYYIDVPSNFWGNISYFNSMWARLVGKPVSLESFWELTPWSWMVDWFFDLQSVFAAVDRFSDENLVVNYGYLMRSVQCTTNVETELYVATPQNEGTEKRTVRTTYTSKRMERVRMNPFGIGVKTPEGLTAIQVSLLSAVGLARLT